MRRPTAVHEIVQERVISHLELAKQMLNFLTPYDPHTSKFSYVNYLKGRSTVLREVLDLGLVRLGPPENRYEYILLSASSFEAIFEVGLQGDMIIADPELASAVRLEYWMRYGGKCPLIIEPLRESNEILN